MNCASAPGLFIIDGIAPFFRGVGQEIINWSKAPFADLEEGEGLKPGLHRQIQTDFRTFCDRASAAGYNAVTLDDLAHCCIFDFYSDGLTKKVREYRALFSDLIDVAAGHGMQVIFTTDLLFFNEAIDRHVASNDKALRRFAAAACRQLFEIFPAVGGIVCRIGEADGIDVEGDFRSRLVIRRPAQARRMLETLLPVFAEFDRLLIFRTWSVGVGRVGDIIWNPETYDAVFQGLES